MVILGLGSNLNDRLDNLRQAYLLIKKIPHLTVTQVSPIYKSDALLPDNAPTHWNMPYLNLALRCETTLSPYELLQHTKEIEYKVGRRPEKNWGPRVIDIDMLAWDDFIQYDEKLHIPHEHLHDRPFALWPLADIAPRWIHPKFKKTASELCASWGSRFTGDSPLHTHQIPHRIDTPQLVGILNITPDSFSDGGKFVDPFSAIKQIYALVESGAEIIDIGAESTRPQAELVDANLEWERLEPVLKQVLPLLNDMVIPPKISIDTRHASVAEKALGLNVDWINDVSGLIDPAMREIVSQKKCDVVVMHQLGIPAGNDRLLPNDHDPVGHVYQWCEEKIESLEKSGIPAQRIIFDVGIGYGKTPEQSLELLKSIAVFHEFNTRLLIGHSRKSFLQQFTSLAPSERDIETLVLSLFLEQQKVDYLRVHNVGMHARGFKVHKALGN